MLFLRQSQPGKEYFAKLEHKHGKAKALTVLAPKLGRAVDSMLTREQAFDLTRFVAASSLKGETEPPASLAHAGLSLLQLLSLYTASTVKESLDHTPEASGCDWTVSLAPLLGEASPRVLWLPLRRVWHSRGVSADTTRSFAKTGRRAQTSFSGAASADTAALLAPNTRTATLKRCVVQPQAVTSTRNQVSHNRWARRNHHLFRRGSPRLRAVHPSARLTMED